MVGPDYSRPDTPANSWFRFGESSTSSSSTFGDLDWRSVFHDTDLRNLIEQGLANNLDCQAAVARVIQAQANLTVVRSQLVPNVGIGYSGEVGRVTNKVNPLLSGDYESHAGALAMFDYEFDFWGRIRRSSEAARAQLLASQEGERQIQQALVAGIATAYLTLREQDEELAISIRTLKARKESQALISAREKGGQSALPDVKQADVLVAEAEATIQQIEKQIAQLEHQLSALCGRAPDSIRRGRALNDQGLVIRAPSGLQSGLLARRPDIRLAEQQLVSANARIGVAQAELLPRISLTASAGFSSNDLADLVKNPNRYWKLGPTVNLPLFTGGRLRANVAANKAARDEAEAMYRRSVVEALREVSDSLVACQKNTSFREATGRVVDARTAALGLIRETFINGATSYLDVLYNDQQLFSAELTHCRARLAEMTAVVDLYRALGGGWDKSSAPAAIPATKQ
jgi:multidrug efflux system outer membrane protein